MTWKSPAGKNLFMQYRIENAMQFCPFANQICKWLAKYLHMNDKDV